MSTGELTENIIVEYGPVPETGACTAEPQSGYALATRYNITCSGFSVADGHQLKYSLYTYHLENYEKGILAKS